MSVSATEPDLAQLELATKLVAGLYAGPHCVEASALLVEVGTRLGFKLEARPVSLFAHNYTPVGSVATGDRGRAFGESFLARNAGRIAVAGEFEGGSLFQRHAGHMVVLSDERSLLMDPTFAQFAALGAQAEALFVSNVPMKAGAYWHVGGDEFFARYFAADDYKDRDFNDARDALQPQADRILAYILKQDVGV